jgi:murein DD-endopeptidase MepM/ murein hydrolase activator NlpD
LRKYAADGHRHADDVRHDHARATIATRVNRLSIRAARALQARLRGRVAVSPGPFLASMGRLMSPFRSAERALPIAVAAIVAFASMLALLPSTSRGSTGSTDGPGTDIRVAINGGVNAYDETGYNDTSAPPGPDSYELLGIQGTSSASFQPITIPSDITTEPGAEQASLEPGAVLDDGTLITGYAPQTTVEDGADLIQTYKVKSGDTLSEIAHRYGVSMMTLWWANKLKSKDDLHIGQVLRIPPVSGLVYTVKATDTMDAVASRYKVAASQIVKLNGLEDSTLVVGQVLILPGAKGAPIPTPKPTPKPAVKSSRPSSSGGGHSTGPVHYSGGKFRWPVIGGGNYISQYFHYGHEAIDIAAQYGSTVVAAAGGRVTFAGWKSNGGGWQVWISHGNNLYTTYNHMSALTVGTGQSVGRGQQVGRIGQSGNATGPHLHFEVWIGPIWSGGTRVNPLRYF